MDFLRRPLFVKRSSKSPCWRRHFTLPSVTNHLIKPGFSVETAAAKRFLSLSLPESREESVKISSLLGCRGAAGRTCRVLADADRMKAGAQRIVEQQGAVEAVAEPQELLQHLDCLQGAEDAGDGTQDAGGLAARYEIGRRRLAEEAAVAGVTRAEIGPEGRDLALEGRQGCRDERLFEAEAEFGQEIPGGEIVAAVGDEIVAADQRLGIFRGEPHRMGLDAHAGIDRGEGRARALDLERADAFGRMDDLALQVGQVDPVGIGDADRPDPGGREVEQQRRTETARTDDEHPRLQQPDLALLADLVEDQVAGVALELLLAQLHQLQIPSKSAVVK